MPIKISIITVTYNADKVLEKTIESIIGQTAFESVEYILVDGNSKDGTKDIIAQYQNKISKWVSEPDKGIYDAMNKGLNLATGDFVWFINAGDELANHLTVERVLRLINQTVDVLYGETIDVTEDGQEIGMRRLKAPKRLTWRSFQKGMLVCHQSILIRKKLVGEYNLKYKISADQDWVISALKKAKNIVNTNQVLSKFAKGGASGKNIILSLKERFDIMKKHYGFIPTVLHHIPIGLKFIWFFIRNKRF